MSPEISEPRDVSRIIKALERIFNEQKDKAIRHKMINTSMAYLKRREVKGYFQLIPLLDQIFPDRSHLDLRKIIIFFELLTDDEAQKINDFLNSLLPPRIGLEQFMAKKLGLNPKSLHDPIDKLGYHPLNPFQIFLASTAYIGELENFRFRTNRHIDDKEIDQTIREFCQLNGYNCESDDTFGYRAIKDDQEILITVSNFSSFILITVFLSS